MIKPSQVNLHPVPHFTGCAGRAEREFALGLYVRACQVRGDAWQPVIPRDIGETLKADVESGTEPWAHLSINPFWRPDFRDLVTAGYARWLGEGSGAPVELTETGMAAIDKWVARVGIVALAEVGDDEMTKPVCSTCNDTHRMSRGEGRGDVMCTARSFDATSRTSLRTPTSTAPRAREGVGSRSMTLDATTALLPFGFDDGATFSACRGYRYRLWRAWGSREHRCVFVGLNPSTADETKDDPTIRKCVGFAKRWGFGAIDMVNLFAWRSTDPSGLLKAAPDHVGCESDQWLAPVFAAAHRIVWCWGQHNAGVRRLVQQRITSEAWTRLLIHRARCEQGTLGLTQSGAPRHPLMLAYATRFEAA